jgi:poly-gamma-glutamate capsule biosynthesis protein CapA/YwtB (metallophosphatase superfamily)/cell division protein FtsL
MDNQTNTPERTPEKTPRQLAEEQRAERLKYMKRQRNIRMGAIALAIVLAIVSLCVSCSTKKAVADLAEKIAAKKAAQEALAAEVSAAPSAVPTVSPSAQPEDSVSLTLSFTGDVTLASYEGAGYEGSFEEYYDNYGDDYFFQNVRSIFEGDDLTVVNLEGTFTTSTNRVNKQWTFKSDPSYVSILTKAGIDCVNVANNHTKDYGNESYVDTLATLDNAGIQRFGNDYTTIVEVKGVKIGFSGIYECEEGIGCKDLAVENVQKLKEDGAQIIICEFHWGDENSYTPNDVHTVLAKAVIDEGADLVVAHHPHVLQGISTYKGKYICYSLGNFCFGGNSVCRDKDTMIFQQTFTLVNGEVQDAADYNIIPCSISTETTANTYCPTPATGEEAQRILTKIYDMSAQLEGGISPKEDGDTGSSLEESPVSSPAA